VYASLIPYGITINPLDSGEFYEFRYTHPLSEPFLSGRPTPERVLGDVTGQTILVYGMLEGVVTVAGDVVVYDPQSETDATPLKSVIRQFQKLAIVLNEREVIRLGRDSNPVDAARKLLRETKAEVVVIKRGPYGCTTVEDSRVSEVPVFPSDYVFKIGTGDVFSAAFANFWAVDKLHASKAAEEASKCTSRYARTRSIEAVAETDDIPLVSRSKKNTPKVYLAGPFFSISQRILVEEARRALLSLGVEVFSPLHDVGLEGTEKQIAQNDLKGLNKSTVVLALIADLDVGTIFETGYARAKSVPVVAYCEGVKNEHLTMLMGSGCLCNTDFCSSLYNAAWVGM
jgi:nucleoside 2-deoxyribosyltransferase